MECFLVESNFQFSVPSPLSLCWTFIFPIFQRSVLAQRHSWNANEMFKDIQRMEKGWKCFSTKKTKKIPFVTEKKKKNVSFSLISRLSVSYVAYLLGFRFHKTGRKSSGKFHIAVCFSFKLSSQLTTSHPMCMDMREKIY